MSFSVKLEGYQELINKLQSIPDETGRKVDDVIGEHAQLMATSAKRLAPKNDGILVNSIQADRNGYLNWSVGAYAPYAAYMEFGTKKKFDPVNGYEELAAAAKGKGKGNYREFIKSLTRWVEKKISKKNAKSIAFAIARRIIVDGVKGNHYFTRSIEAYRGKMIKAIGEVINK